MTDREHAGQATQLENFQATPSSVAGGRNPTPGGCACAQLARGPVPFRRPQGWIYLSTCGRGRRMKQWRTGDGARQWLRRLSREWRPGHPNHIRICRHHGRPITILFSTFILFPALHILFQYFSLSPARNMYSKHVWT